MEDKDSADSSPDSTRALGVIPTYDEKLTIGSNGTPAREYGDVLVVDYGFNDTGFDHTLDNNYFVFNKIIGGSFK
ncbi:hypothetical protein [Thermococcus paralvinellae]|uniref:hypothetical protein n=1 Tax=Thermococcus paralvinellae TaxID=582419 RepID=UPI0005B25FCB|nr:hypothetical protein [Thermococcus paralvinellae]